MKAPAARCIYARSVCESCSSASASTLLNDTKNLQGFTRQLVSLTKSGGRATDYEYSTMKVAMTDKPKKILGIRLYKTSEVQLLGDGLFKVEANTFSKAFAPGCDLINNR